MGASTCTGGLDLCEAVFALIIISYRPSVIWIQASSAQRNDNRYFAERAFT